MRFSFLNIKLLIFLQFTWENNQFPPPIVDIRRLLINKAPFKDLTLQFQKLVGIIYWHENQT